MVTVTTTFDGEPMVIDLHPRTEAIVCGHPKENLRYGARRNCVSVQVNEQPGE